MNPQPQYPAFRAGDRVLCVDSSENPTYPGMRPLQRGKVYVVRAIARGKWKPSPFWGLFLKGLYVGIPGTDNREELAFHPRRFAPVIERQYRNQIEMFKDIASGRTAVALLDGEQFDLFQEIPPRKAE